MCGSRLPSACTSMCATSSRARSTLSRIVGMITIVRADSGMQDEVEPGQAPRRNEAAQSGAEGSESSARSPARASAERTTASIGHRQPCA